MPGVPQIGGTWSVNVGTWSGSPLTFQNWLRCNQPVTANVSAIPAGCIAISDATETTYTSTDADAGKYLTALVSAVALGRGTAKLVALSTVSSGGPISVLYASMGGDTGTLGAAITGLIPYGVGTGQAFKNGSIFSHPTYGTWAIMNGPIRDEWTARGYFNGPLGWPTGSQTCVAGVCS